MLINVNACTSMHICFGEEYDLDDEPPCGHRGCPAPPMVVMHVTLRCSAVRYIHKPNGLHYDYYYYMLTD